MRRRNSTTSGSTPAAWSRSSIASNGTAADYFRDQRPNAAVSDAAKVFWKATYDRTQDRAGPVGREERRREERITARVLQGGGTDDEPRGERIPRRRPRIAPVHRFESVSQCFGPSRPLRRPRTTRPRDRPGRRRERRSHHEHLRVDDRPTTRPEPTPAEGCRAGFPRPHGVPAYRTRRIASRKAVHAAHHRGALDDAEPPLALPVLELWIQAPILRRAGAPAPAPRARQHRRR